MNDHEKELCTKTYGNILSPRPPQKNNAFGKFLKIFMVSDKTIHKAFRIHKLYNL